MYEEENYWKRAMSKRLSRRQALRSAVLAGLGVAGAGIVGCGSSTSPTPTGVQAAATAAATKAAAVGTTPAGAATAAVAATPAVVKPDGKIMVALTSLGEENLDPHLVKDGSNYPIRMHLFDGLLRLDVNGKPIPALASEWKKSDDGKTWEFKLRQGVKFHNGDPLTADDVKFSVERFLSPQFMKAVRGPIWDRYFNQVTVKDPSTAVFELKNFWPAFPYELALFLDIVPKAYLGKVGDEAFGKQPVGTGPFKFVKYERSVGLDMEATGEHLFRFASIKSVSMKIIPEMATRVAQLKAGEADIIEALTGAVVGEIKGDSTFKVVSAKQAAAMPYFFMDALKDPKHPFNDVRVRQAMNICIDRKALADKLYFGEAVAETTPVFPSSFGYDSTLKPYPYDPEAAKKLLADAGYANGFETNIDTYITGTFPFSKELMEAMIGYFSKIGIKCSGNVAEYTYYIPAFRDKKINGMGGTAVPASVYYDAGNMYEIHVWSKGTYSGLNSPKCDELIDKSSSEVDPAKREAILKQIHGILHDEYLILTPLHVNKVYGLGPRMQDLQLVLGGSYTTTLETAKLKPGK